MNTADFMTAGYLIFLFIGVSLWVASRDNKHPNMASLGQMMEGILHNRATRLGLGIFWWWLGWHFLVSIIGR